jgi:hypothetical protein
MKFENIPMPMAISPNPDVAINVSERIEAYIDVKGKLCHYEALVD